MIEEPSEIECRQDYRRAITRAVGAAISDVPFYDAFNSLRNVLLIVQPGSAVGASDAGESFVGNCSAIPG